MHFSSDLEWSADGREIYYVAQGASGGKQIMAVDGRSRLPTKRTVISGHGEYVGLAASGNGDWLYFCATDELFSCDLYRVAPQGGAPELLVEDVADRFSLTFRANSADFELSSDGSRIALTVLDTQSTSGSVVVMDLTAGWTRAFALGVPVVFAPEGDRLLYYGCAPGSDNDCIPQIGSFLILDLDSGTVEQLLPRRIRFGIIHWNQHGIWFSREIDGDLVVQEMTGGQTIRLAFDEANPGPQHSAGFGAWSPDGSLAAWKTSCIQEQEHQGIGIAPCDTLRWALYHFDAAGQNPRGLVVLDYRFANYDEKPSLLTFAPDGGSVAYVSGGRLFVQDVY